MLRNWCFGFRPKMGILGIALHQSKGGTASAPSWEAISICEDFKCARQQRIHYSCARHSYTSHHTSGPALPHLASDTNTNLFPHVKTILNALAIKSLIPTYWRALRTSHGMACHTASAIIPYQFQKSALPTPQRCKQFRTSEKSGSASKS